MIIQQKRTKETGWKKSPYPATVAEAFIVVTSKDDHDFDNYPAGYFKAFKRQFNNSPSRFIAVRR